jgi:hypothetical protein
MWEKLIFSFMAMIFVQFLNGSSKTPENNFFDEEKFNRQINTQSIDIIFSAEKCEKCKKSFLQDIFSSDSMAKINQFNKEISDPELYKKFKKSPEFLKIDEILGKPIEKLNDEQIKKLNKDQIKNLNELKTKFQNQIDNFIPGNGIKLAVSVFPEIQNEFQGARNSEFQKFIPETEIIELAPSKSPEVHNEFRGISNPESPILTN